MTNAEEAREVHATATSFWHSQEPANGGQAQRPDVLDGEVVDDEDIDDEDAVILEEMSAVRAGDDVSPVAADDEPVRDQATSTPAGTTISGAVRPGGPVGAGTPAGTNMVGDPEKLHQQWAAIQSTFVDDPRGSVAAAAEFVTGTIEALVASAQEREHALRGEWDRDGVDTEGLRNALRSYRGLLDQLVR